MPSDLLLPLFPLEVVMLPAETLPLHIFEERYKLMIGEAIEQRSEFGIVLSKDRSLLNVGCTAAVEKVTKRYPDGRMDILSAGRRRFEILFLDEEKPYLRAGVHFFADDPDTAPAGEKLRRLTDLFEQVLGFLPAQSREAPTPESGSASFAMASVLPLDLDLKQRLLSLKSESERVAALSDHLEKLLPRLALARRVERSSRGNGRGT